ncbi:hypothetical protein [Microbacterium sp. BR1]|uniref:hypothetical protein n=1 Tax=Microbacterium sp. BR1 TaxID=1070896 RepID=UPI0012FD5F5E|nr:hypothetical protein [Microbacterium sp. BR1]
MTIERSKYPYPNPADISRIDNTSEGCAGRPLSSDDASGVLWPVTTGLWEHGISRRHTGRGFGRRRCSVTETVTLGADFERGIRFEGLRESITGEIARRNAAAHTAGLDTPEGRRQTDAIAALVQVRKRLRSDDDEQLLIAELLLQVQDSDRAHARA